MTYQVFWPGTQIVKSMNNAFTEHLRAKAAPISSEPTCPCKVCGHARPVSDFYAGNKSTCSTCLKARGNEYRKPGPKLDLTPRRSVTWKAPHGGAYSKASASEKAHG